MDIPDREPDFTCAHGLTRYSYYIAEGIGVAKTVKKYDDPMIFAIKIEEGELYWRHIDYSNDEWVLETNYANSEYKKCLEKTFYSALEEEISKE